MSQSNLQAHASLALDFFLLFPTLRFFNVVFCSVKEHVQLSEYLFETVRYCTWSLLSTIVLQLIIIIQTHHHRSIYFIL